MMTVPTSDQIRHWVAEAHLPSLVVTLAHLTGRADLLRDDWFPKYVPYEDPRSGGLSEAAQAELAEVAVALIPLLLNRDSADFSAPPAADLERMMRFVAGVEIPQRYLPLLQDALGIGDIRPTLRQAPAPGFKVLVIGGGMSGLLAGVKLKQAGYDFEIVERQADIGGTWHANTYPACRVDTPNHLYSYSFFPNHDWPHRFSMQEALKRYFHHVADVFGLWDHIRLATSVEEARYDEVRGCWKLLLRSDTDGVREETVNAVISSVGQLNRPKIPTIAGQDRFAGAQFHANAWRHDVVLDGADVAVIGTGATAFQLIPAIADRTQKLTILQRSAPWFSPQPDYHLEVPEGQKALFKSLPRYADWYRFYLFWTITEGVMPAMRLDPAWQADDGSINALNQRFRNLLAQRMTAQIGDRTDLLDKVIPKVPFGGKRTLRDNGSWIATLKRENVELVTTRIKEITADGIVMEDGQSHSADVIIYGTGFEAARFIEPTRIYGRKGVELGAMWDGDPKAYLGITVPDFPNFFMIYGPNTNLVAQGSIVFISECAVGYIVQCLDLLTQTGRESMEPLRDVHDAYNDRIDQENAVMAWGLPQVENWYKSASGRVSQNWPFPLADYWSATRAPNAAEFRFDGRIVTAAGTNMPTNDQGVADSDRSLGAAE